MIFFQDQVAGSQHQELGSEEYQSDGTQLSQVACFVGMFYMQVIFYGSSNFPVYLNF